MGIKNLGIYWRVVMSNSLETAGAGPKKILVVDDTPSVSDLIREMLKAFGHKALISAPTPSKRRPFRNPPNTTL